MSPNPQRGKKNDQKTHQGRRLEFPAEERGYGGAVNQPDIRRCESANLMRSSSASTFVDKTLKSSQIKAQRAEFDEKFKVAFGMLLDQNEAYLKETRRVCNQKARPRDESFKIKRPTIATTNQNEYTKKGTPYAQSMEPRN